MSLQPSKHSNNSQIDLTLIDEISRSILSNLDRDSLLNSSITLLHQVFGFSKVTLYTTRGEDRTVLRMMSIAPDGLVPESTYHANGDAAPVDWCVAHLDPVVINDTAASNRFQPTGDDHHTRSELILPLLQGERLVGVLELSADTKDVFIPETVQAFTLLAGHLAIAISNANLYCAEQTRRLVAEHLHEVIGAIDIDVSLDEIFEQVFDALEEYFPLDAAAIWLMDNASEEIGLDQFIPAYLLAAAHHKDPLSSAAFERYLHDPSEANQLFSRYAWIKQVIEQKQAAATSQGQGNEPIGVLLGYDSPYSALAAPLVIHSQAIGAIVCVDHDPDQYNEESILIMEAFANHVATAIENTRLYVAAHDQAWISTVLLQVTEATQSATNLDDLLETIASILPDLIGADACAVFLWDASIETFYYQASSGFSDVQASRLKEWDISSDPIAAFERLMEYKNPIILDESTISAEITASIFPGYNFGNDLMILFPLMAHNSLCGAILVDFSNSELNRNSNQDLWDEKYTLVQGAANQAANAIENLQLLKSQEEEAYISVALLQVAQAVVSLKQLDEILATIVRITPILVGVKRCIIYTWDSKERLFHPSAEYGFSKHDVEGLGQAIGLDEFPLLGAIREHDSIIYASLGVQDSPTAWNEIPPSGWQAIRRSKTETDEDAISIKLDESAFTGIGRLLIGFPLSVKSENLGVMLVEEEQQRGTPSVHLREKRMQIVKGITQQAAIAIKNEQLQLEAVKSERMERELQLAREIQATFLPEKIPDIPGWDIDVHWQPAREVGGDFYDFLMLDDHRIGFVMADVADKGMPAALFMTLIRTLIRAAAKDKTSPAAVLKQVNELLIPDTKHGLFVTVFYGVVSVDSGEVIYANAGHNPPLVKRHDRHELIELTRTSMALGIFDDIEVEEQAVTLDPGDCVFLYTDGITEAFSSQGEMFGVTRLMKLLADSQFSSSHGLSVAVIEAVQDFIHGAELSDDMTMGVIYRKIP